MTVIDNLLTMGIILVFGFWVYAKFNRLTLSQAWHEVMEKIKGDDGK